MKKTVILIIISFSLLTSCRSQTQTVPTKDNAINLSKYAKEILASDLKKALYYYASDSLEGRRTGEPGQKKAVEYIKNRYISMGISSPLANGDYFQHIPESFFRPGIKASENVVAFIKGSEKPEEIIIISAHLDHIGISSDGQINNGADDDGSGTVAVIEIAKAFKAAVNDGNRPKRSILFLHFTGEELGLYGSKYYTTVDPIFPLSNTVTDLNIDMIGRIDSKHTNQRNYLYLIGADKLSSELNTISEEVNKKYFNMEFDYTYNDENDPNRFYYRSDHYNFAKMNVPVIFYFNGTHVDYHKPTDTPDKIQYDLLETRAKLIFYTAWELANRDKRIVVDKL